MLTDSGDVVLDIFGGSNTTGEAAEQLDRKWVCVEADKDYAISSGFRFMSDWSVEEVKKYVRDAKSGNENISLCERAQKKLLF
jgi:site-specific DNA-methyltransferase (cytosine-N4-specific)